LLWLLGLLGSVFRAYAALAITRETISALNAHCLCVRGCEPRAAGSAGRQWAPVLLGSRHRGGCWWSKGTWCRVIIETISFPPVSKRLSGSRGYYQVSIEPDFQRDCNRLSIYNEAVRFQCDCQVSNVIVRSPMRLSGLQSDCQVSKRDCQVSNETIRPPIRLSGFQQISNYFTTFPTRLSDFH
jgi:hypothetical protein